jgi:hypothetical protein
MITSSLTNHLEQLQAPYWVWHWGCGQSLEIFRPNKMMNRFIVKTLIVSVLCVTIGNLLPFFSDMANHPIWLITIAFYFLLTILLRSWVAKSQKGSAIKFSTAVIGTTTAKMLLTLVIVTTYLVAKLPNRELFVFGVFGVFVAFSVLFVMDVQRLIKGG